MSIRMHGRPLLPNQVQGSAYQRLGSRLSIVELAPSLLPGVDADLTRVVHKRLEQRGAQILTEARAKSWERTESCVRLTLERGGQTK